MKFAEAAQTAFAKTREFYKSGPKSSNKVYDLQRTPLPILSRAQAHNVKRDEADKKLTEIRAIELKTSKLKLDDLAPIAHGSILVNLGMRAANCGELSAIACYFAYKQLGRPSFAHLAYLTPPGDHAFCIVGDLRGYPVKGGKVSDLSKLWMVGSEEPWAVDAWANVCCALSDYPALMEAKMKKWTGDGKRVAWMGVDRKSPGWYVPSGQYGTTFLDSAVNVVVGG